MINKFNEDNVTEGLCLEAALKAGYEYVSADELRMDEVTLTKHTTVNETDNTP